MFGGSLGAGSAYLNWGLADVPREPQRTFTTEPAEGVDAGVMDALAAVLAGLRQADVADEAFHQQHVEVHHPTLLLTQRIASYQTPYASQAPKKTIRPGCRDATGC